jgi:hypothetical protein
MADSFRKPFCCERHRKGLELSKLNVKYEGEKSAKHAYRAQVPGGWLIFIRTPGPSGLGGVTFYPDANHAWEGGTQGGS